MKKLFLVLTALIVAILSFAQTTKISGIVKDGNQKTIESATIALLRVKDSSIAKVSVANRDGLYIFENIPAGKYLVSISAVGHEKGYSETFELSSAKSDITLKTIELIPQTKQLGGVTVVAKKPLVEQKIDRTIINVEASVTNVGSSALEVLEKSPGVSVDRDGNISLKGKEGVMVLVDGRPTQLSSADLANLLRNMNASQLDQIEIMTNPPAKYDAAGNAGIINIKTKKNKQAGYNGSATLGYGQGKYPKFNESFTFKYKEGKVNVFYTLSHNYRKNFNTLTINRNLLNSTTKILEKYFDQQANMINEGNNYSAKIGLDYFATKKTTLGIVFNGFSSPGTFGNRNQTLITDPNHNLLNDTRATVDNTQDWKNFSTNLNFRTLLDTTGKELTADVDYITYDSKSSQLLINSYFDGAGSPLSKADTLMGSLPQNIKIYSGRVDYYQPMKGDAKLEAGIKSSLVKTDNNAQYDSVQYGNTVHDYGRSNHFVYEENINAAYVNLNKQLSKKWGTQLGLRLENTNAKGTQLTTGEVFERHYTQLFPTLFVQYKANDKNTFGLNYGRRLRRPNYESLNPFIRFLDRYTYQQGNPDLQPQFSHNIELSHTYKGFLTTTLNYTKTTDIIQGVVEQKGEEAYAKQANIASQRQYGISISANNPITKWWTNSIYVSVSNNDFKGVLNNSPLHTSATTLALNGSQQFKFAKTWTAELSGFYRTSGAEGVFIIKPMGMLSFGLSKQVLNNQGTLRLNIRDLFYTQSTSGSTKYGNVDARFREERDSRVVNIGFTYRFSKGKISNQKKRTNGSAGEEQNRVGVGN
jgi:outer membrane receptor protein involved in Fe transport